MQFQCRVYGQADLDGTHRAILETDRVSPRTLAEAPGPTAYVQVQRLSRTCGCILSEIKPSKEAILRVDRFKLVTLNLRDGDSAEFDFFEPEIGRASCRERV